MLLVVEDKLLFIKTAGVAGRFTKYLNHASSAQPKRATKIGSISLEASVWKDWRSFTRMLLQYALDSGAVGGRRLWQENDSGGSFLIKS